MKGVYFTALLAIALMPVALAAQGPEPDKAIHGAVTTGYRFTSVSGREEKYRELFNLRSGFRVSDLSLYSGDKQKSRFYDSFFLTSSGIGGEPFSGGQFSIKKNHVYDLRVNYQQSYFFFDRNDSQPQPSGVNGLMTNHDWSTVRKIGSVNLATYLTRNLRLNFEYQHSDRKGPTDTTRTLDYFNAPLTWASFLRANPYEVQALLDDNFDRSTAGLSYSTRKFSVFYRTGYQWFTQAADTKNFTPQQRSINIDDPTTAKELLTQASWLDERKLRTPVSEFSYNATPTSRIRVRGGYIFYRYGGPRATSGSFAGSARTTGTNVAPYSVTFSEQANTKEHTHVLDQGFSVDVLPRLIFHADYRYYRFTTETGVDYTSTTSPAAAVTGTADSDWRNETQSLDLALEYRPIDKLQIKPGIRLTRRDVLIHVNGVSDPQSSKRSEIVSPILTVYYSPSTKITLRGDIQTGTNGTPYTRISPRRDFNLRWIGRYQPTEKFSIEDNLHVRTSDYTTTEYRNAIRSNGTNFSYQVHKKLSVLGGFTYDSFLATASVNFLRGPAPLNATWRDQTINRVWQAGVEATPVKRLTLNVTGNYLRTTGVGEISGEPPISGPIRWPLVTGTMSYDFPHAGRFSVDLQRTYYIEEILRGDNFGAGLLNIRWTKEF